MITRHPLSGRGFYAIFRKDHDVLAEHIGRQRQAEAQKRGREHRNNLQLSDSDGLRQHVFGARCEVAFHIFHPTLKWNRQGEEVGLPDFADFIDVKGANRIGLDQRKRTNLIHYDPNPDWAFMLVVEIDMGVFWMAGWLWGREVREFDLRELQPGRPAHVCPLETLRPFRSLPTERP